MPPGATPKRSGISQHSLQVLEYSVVRDLVESKCQSVPGRLLARELLPSIKPEVVNKTLTLVEEAAFLLEIRKEFSLDSLEGLDPVLKILGKSGSSLRLVDLVSLRLLLRTAASVRKRFEDLAENSSSVPSLQKEFDSIPLCREVRERIGSLLTEEGTWRDDASPTLLAVRGKIKSTRSRVMTIMEKMLNEPSVTHLLADRLITSRHGRYVLPVKVSQADKLKGTVIDQSSRGGTLFVEPQKVASLNADLSRLQAEEEREITRILREVTAELSPWASAFGRILELLARLDLIQAMAAVSRNWGGNRPEESADGILLLAARHPAVSGMVPLDIRLGGDFSAVVLSGPNTGGKTVVLKTLGLMILIHQTGLLAPVDPGSRLPIFREILADIGDEQSLQQSLSTFSGHIVHLAGFLSKAKQGDLVLLDELGAGTEPMEGAALGMAILEEFSQRGCLTMITTHHEALKEMALVKPGFQNACLEFDVATAMPTYRLRYGLPGESQALAIADRYGIPGGVVKRAKELADRGGTAPEALMERLLREEASLEKKESAMADLEKKLADRQTRLIEKETHFEKEMGEIGQKARKTIRNLLREARQEVKKTKEDLRKGQEPTSWVDRISGRVGRKLGRLEVAVPGPGVSPKESGEAPQVGRKVYLPGLKIWGEVLSVTGWPREVEVAVGRSRLRLPGVALDLDRVSSVKRGTRIDVSADLPESGRLDLRGERVEEAVPEVERFLDRAVLGNLTEVEIIHGKGTGALREAIWSCLKDHPGVASFQGGEWDRGGSGMTVVFLK